MRRPRIFLPASPEPGDEVSVPEADRHHLLRVLRLGPGDRLAGVTPEGVELELELVAGDVARVLGASRPAVEPRTAVTLALAVPRGGRMDWVVEKAVEIGAAAIQPLLADRCPVTEAGTQRTERWRRLAESAARQSRRLTIPEIRTPVRLAEAVRAADGPCLVAHPGGGGSISAVLAGGDPRRALLLAIGPEGGFTEAEVASALAAGARQVSLGPRILRVETAALVALTLALAALGDLAPA